MSSAVTSKPDDLALVDPHAPRGCHGDQPRKFVMRRLGLFADRSRVIALVYTDCLSVARRFHHTITSDF